MEYYGTTLVLMINVRCICLSWNCNVIVRLLTTPSLSSNNWRKSVIAQLTFLTDQYKQRHEFKRDPQELFLGTFKGLFHCTLYICICISITIYFFKGPFVKMSLFLLFSSTRLSCFIPIYILMVLINGFVYALFAWFIISLYIFTTVDFNYSTYLYSRFNQY